MIKDSMRSPMVTLKAILFLYSQPIVCHVNTKGHITLVEFTHIGNRGMYKSEKMRMIYFSYRSLFYATLISA